MRTLCISCLAGLLLVGLPVTGMGADDSQAIQSDYTAYVNDTFPVKGRHYQVYEDYELEKHKRPIQKIGKLITRAKAGEDLGWQELENAFARFCREKGADAVINMRYSHEVNETVEPGDEMWLESDLIVYLDQDEFGHVGFWYHNNRPEIPGIRVEMVVRDSPAAQAGIRPGDIVKGISGESTGAMNIQNKDDYREAKLKFRARQEYKFYVERNGQPKLLTVVPMPDLEVYDWTKRFGGL